MHDWDAMEMHICHDVDGLILWKVILQSFMATVHGDAFTSTKTAGDHHDIMQAIYTISDVWYDHVLMTSPT